MAFRTFVDQSGLQWEVRPQSRDEWELSPTGDNPGPARTVPPPGYETDPYEMSREELLLLLDQSAARTVRKVKNPFGDA
jgi:hypothetical protein